METPEVERISGTLGEGYRQHARLSEHDYLFRPLA